jgi:predicted naringenin-chalcone synthase
MERMGLRLNIHRTAVNFMGCYAAVHGLKMADSIAKSEPNAKVLVVCTELCSLHFQKAYSMDSAAAALLFADGSASALVVSDSAPGTGLRLDGFYAEVLPAGKKDMAWALSSTGFQMTLTGYIPDLVGRDLGPLKDRALGEAGLKDEDIRYWCIHPGGKRILQTVKKGLHLSSEDLACSYKVLREQGNMSSVTILAVLAEMWKNFDQSSGAHLFGAAFGPGLTMESFIGTVI